MKKIIVLLALFAIYGAKGQNDEAYVDQLTHDFTMKLEERGITNYFTTKRYCSGKIEMFKIGREKKLCASKGTYFSVYVVWKEEDNVKLKKIDNCSLFYSVTLEDTNLHDFFATNMEALRSETVKNYKSASYTGIPEKRKKPQPCYRSFGFTEGGETISQTYNLFNVSADGATDNVNYEHNSQLKVIELDALMDAVLADYEVNLRRQI